MRNDRYHFYWTQGVPDFGTPALDTERGLPMTDYEPGWVGKATVRGVPNKTVMRASGTAGADTIWMTPDYVYNTRRHSASDVTDLRRLITIPVEDANGILIYFRSASMSLNMQRIFAEIEKQMTSVSEPMHVGAVVEDINGELWVRVLRPGGLAPWRKSDRGPVNCWASWQSIRVVRVVPPEELIDS